MSHQLIDMTKGPRSGQFACFRQMLFPFAGVTAEVDITDFAARRQGRPFFLSFLYAVVRAANAVPQLRRRIRDAFGEVFRGTELDRQKLGSLVFSDPQALERLNGIIFDYLPGVLRRKMEGRVLVGLDAINLIESGLGELCCRTVAVLAPGEQRVQRIMQRDHIPEEYARLRIQAQKPDSYYREHCTDVLENQEETPEAFREKAEIFFRNLLRQLHHITEGGHEQ